MVNWVGFKGPDMTWSMDKPSAVEEDYPQRGRARVRWVSQLMVLGRREWDIPLLCSIFYRYDVEEILKIRLSDRVEEDFIAWFYNKTGLFPVRSAYHLAVQVENWEKHQVGSSSTGDGRRPVLNKAGSGNVPTKVRIFAWRLATYALATQENRKRHTLEKAATYQVCGMVDETGHHAVIRCTKAVALRSEM
jgi:hypothetical protein